MCIDALEGAPGIHSARYEETPQKRINRVLKEMFGVPYEYRTAHFHCSMILVNPKGEVVHKKAGEVFGYIDDSPKGTNGFGYDPIFIVPEYDKTMAELPEEVKNEISHRANALKPMLKWIEQNCK